MALYRKQQKGERAVLKRWMKERERGKKQEGRALLYQVSVAARSRL